MVKCYICNNIYIYKITVNPKRYTGTKIYRFIDQTDTASGTRLTPLVCNIYYNKFAKCSVNGIGSIYNYTYIYDFSLRSCTHLFLKKASR